MSLTDNERAKLSVLFDVFSCVDTSQIDVLIANCRDYEKYCRTSDDIARAQIEAQADQVVAKLISVRIDKQKEVDIMTANISSLNTAISTLQVT